MKVDLISHIQEFDDHYLVISGINDGKLLSVLNKSLELVQEFEITSIQLWGADFHISELEKKVLISIYSTHTTNLANWKYQGFTTHWFELKKISNSYTFDKVATWDSSDIRRIKSVQVNGSLHWIAFRDLNYQNQKERTGKKTIINYKHSSAELNIPELKSSLIMTQYLDHNFDLLVESQKIYLATISLGAPDKCGVIKINPNNEQICFQNFDVPLRKLHHFQSNKLVKIGDKIFAYFWTNSHEPTKNYQFEVYQTDNLNQNEISIKTERLINSDFTHGIIWNKSRKVSYIKEQNTEIKYYSEIDENGRITNERKLENWFPIYFGMENKLICQSSDGKIISLIDE